MGLKATHSIFVFLSHANCIRCMPSPPMCWNNVWWEKNWLLNFSPLVHVVLYHLPVTSYSESYYTCNLTFPSICLFVRDLLPLFLNRSWWNCTCWGLLGSERDSKLCYGRFHWYVGLWASVVRNYTTYTLSLWVGKSQWWYPIGSELVISLLFVLLRKTLQRRGVWPSRAVRCLSCTRHQRRSLVEWVGRVPQRRVRMERPLLPSRVSLTLSSLTWDSTGRKEIQYQSK